MRTRAAREQFRTEREGSLSSPLGRVTMVQVTQASKTRNDPLGAFSPYGAPARRAAPGEYAPQRPPSHRPPPIMPRSHYIGAHLQLPPRKGDPLEERAMRRAIQHEAASRSFERRLQEAETQLALVTGSLHKRDEVIATLKKELTTVRYALDVAQARVWRPEPTRLAVTHRAPSPGDSEWPNEVASLLSARPGSAPIARRTRSSDPTRASAGGSGAPLDASDWLDAQLRQERVDLGEMICASLLPPLGDRAAADDEAQRQQALALRWRLQSLGTEDEQTLAVALRDGGLIERLSEKLLPLLQRLGDGGEREGAGHVQP